MSHGEFRGEVVLRLLKHAGDDRDAVLVEDFAFTGPDGVEWSAPTGSRVNGASIPPALWSTVGPPFVGDYRRASVVHDVACDERTRPHEQVHRMFFDAMRADGVGWVKANVMYQAVRQFGPKWDLAAPSDTALAPTLAPTDEQVIAFAQAVEAAAREIPESEGVDRVHEEALRILTGNTPPSS